MGKKRVEISFLILCLLMTFPNVVFASSENWVEVITFEGNESSRTKSFFCDYPEWRIVARYVPSIHAHHFFDMFDFSATTYLQGDDVNPINTIDLDSGGWIEFENGTTVWTNMRILTSSVLNNVGVFYIQIEAGLIDSYSVTVEQNINSLQESEENWVEVTRFSGSHFTFGLTESFQIFHEDWRVLWKTNNLLPEIEHFDFNVFREEDIVEIGHYDINKSIGTIRTTSNENGTLNIQGYTGFFNIWISPSPAQWELIIEQNIDSIPEFPSWIMSPLFLIATLIVTVYRKKMKTSS